jgi:hypothetical protein
MSDKPELNPNGMTSLMKTWRTLTGLSMEQAVLRLMDVLPPRAYKAVPGAAGLTDIDPSYLTQVATSVFGLCGLGWKYEYDPASLNVTCMEQTTKSGSVRTVYDALLAMLTVQFRYIDEAGEVHWSEPIPANGGSENDQRGFAVRGALTNAIGAAFAKLCWQLPVYQGKIDHHNAAEMYKKAKQSKAGENGGSEGSSAEEKIEQKAEPNETLETERIPESVGASRFAVQTPTDPAARLAWADSIVIPEGIGVPLAGETLGAAKKDKMFGVAILKFLSGKYANASGELFKPTNPEQEELQQAAAVLLDSEGLNGNGKKT